MKLLVLAVFLSISCFVDTGFRFDIQQQEFLSKNLKYYTYFEHLFAGSSPKEIQEKYKLTQEATDKYLRKLVDLKLIQIDSKKRVTFLQQGKTHTAWNNNEPMGLVYNGQLLDSLVVRAKASGPSNPDVNTHLFGLGLTDQEAQRFEEEFAHLLSKYQNRKPKEGSSTQKKHYSGVFLVGEDKSNFFPEVDNEI